MSQSLVQARDGPSGFDSQGLCLLSFDGGGVRGLSALYILKHLMANLNEERAKEGKHKVRPCEVFDLIGGTSTGGLIAIMLGRLQMDVEDCIFAYVKLMSEVFAQKSSRSRINSRFDTKARFDTSRLSRAILEVLQGCGLDENTIFNDGGNLACKVFVCATDTNDRENTTRLRSYQSTKNITALQPTILEAALATSAATTFFDKAEIGNRVFVDGALGANNPVEEVEAEASDLWSPEERELKPLVKCFISIGTGHPGMRQVEDNIFRFLKETAVGIATESNKTAQKFMKRWGKQYDEYRYFRFNVQHGLEDVGLEEYKKQGLVETATEGYLLVHEQESAVRRCVQNLKLKEEMAPDNLQQLIFSMRHCHSLRKRNEYMANIRGLPHVESATPRHNRFDPSVTGCLENTRVDLLNTIQTWITKQNCQPIFWLNGMAGTGKSTIARTISDALQEKDEVVATFFFDSTGGVPLAFGQLLPTLARQLADSASDTLLEALSQAVSGSVDISQARIETQWRKLIEEPLRKTVNSQPESTCVLIIDALDEAKSPNEVSEFLGLISNPSRLESTGLRILITSRRTSGISDKFGTISDEHCVKFSLDDVPYHVATQDISLFCHSKLRNRVSDICDQLSCECAAGRLAATADKLFLFASIACRYVSARALHDDRKECLDLIIEKQHSESSALNAVYELYKSILLEAVQHHSDDEKEQHKFAAAIKKLLGTMTVLSKSFGVSDLAKFAGMAEEDVKSIAGLLHAVLVVPTKATEPVRIIHESFKDFLLESEVCPRRFQIQESDSASHFRVLQACVALMSESLRKDMCDLRAPGTLLMEIPDRRVTEKLSPALGYAIIFWMVHYLLHLPPSSPARPSQRPVNRSLLDGTKRDRKLITDLLKRNRSEYVEALGLAVRILGRFSTQNLKTELISRVAMRMTPKEIENGNVMAFVFALIRVFFRSYGRSLWLYRILEMGAELLPAMESPLQAYLLPLFQSEDAANHTEGGSHAYPAWLDLKSIPCPFTVKNSQARVSISPDCTIVGFGKPPSSLLRPLSNKRVLLRHFKDKSLDEYLRGPFGRHGIQSLTFSPDGTLVAARSDTSIVMIWSVAEGTLQATLKDAKNAGSCIEGSSLFFSVGGDFLFSVSDTMRVWDVATWELRTSYHLATEFEEVSAVIESCITPLPQDHEDFASRLRYAEREKKAFEQSWICLAFSPDGQWAAFAFEHGDQNPEDDPWMQIYVFNRHTGEWKASWLVFRTPEVQLKFTNSTDISNGWHKQLALTGQCLIDMSNSLLTVWHSSRTRRFETRWIFLGRDRLLLFPKEVAVEILRPDTFAIKLPSMVRIVRVLADLVPPPDPEITDSWVVTYRASQVDDDGIRFSKPLI